MKHVSAAAWMMNNQNYTLGVMNFLQASFTAAGETLFRTLRCASMLACPSTQGKTKHAGSAKVVFVLWRMLPFF